MSSVRGFGVAGGRVSVAGAFGLIGALASSGALAGCVAVDSDSRGTAGGPRIHTDMDQGLSQPSTAPVQDVVTGFLGDKGVVPLDDELRMARQRTDERTGLTHVRFEQRVGGLRVVDGYVKAALTDDGELVQVIEQLAPLPADGELAEPSVTPAEALGATLDHLGYADETPVEVAREGDTVVFEQGETFYREPTVEEVAIEVEGALQHGFLVETWADETNLLHHTVVDGEGYVLSVELRTQTDSYNVFVEDPGKGGQVVVAGPGAGSAESPAGWLTGDQLDQRISGNNARAYLDTNNDNAADSGGTAVGDGNFLTAIDLDVAPSTAGNKSGSVQNLFYANNVLHDTLHRHGFDEAAGNFQSDNFGAGGLGNDPVNAEAQDGGGTDNANFATPSDGSSPRMQMYLWSGSGGDTQVVVGGQGFGGHRAGFGPAFGSQNGPLALVVDGGGASTSDGCEAIAAGSLNGRVALVDRGTCDFAVKVLNAQKAGAIAVVVANNAGDDSFAMGGNGRKINIPSMMVGQSAGDALKSGFLGQGASFSSLPPPLMVDASLDFDVVAHEYGHGLTWRMIGNMSGPLAGALGEGSSDVLAFLLNGDDRVGEYSAGAAGGIRRHPYDGYPLTYSSVTGASVHNDGEIYAAAMWAVLEALQGAGKSADDVLGLWIAGMELTPSRPTYEQMRDGLLAAATDAGDDCLIWQAFADKGIGVGSRATVRGSRVTITQSFAVPSECQ